MNKRYIANAKKPIGSLGKKRIEEMNAHHASLIDWGFSQLKEVPFSKCLDLGCGGGETTAKLLTFSANVHCIGLDYSKVAVEEARKRNEDAIAARRCEILKGDVRSLPFGNNEFDLILAVETIYFWPEIQATFQEVSRVLAPGGHFLILNEDDGKDIGLQEKLKAIIPGIEFYDENQLRKFLSPCFQEIVATTRRPWLCVLAKK